MMTCAVPGCTIVATHDLRRTIGGTSQPFPLCASDCVRMATALAKDAENRYATATFTARGGSLSRDEALALHGIIGDVHPQPHAPMKKCKVPRCAFKALYDVRTTTNGETTGALPTCVHDIPHVLAALTTETDFAATTVVLSARWQPLTNVGALAAHGIAE